ncbi:MULTISPECIES: hypothetical protein [unclassified Nocardia]|uniref:hypothetical protein n=1 Tax=unclassified Nocardia TaxID=2637762 RepID=UPI001CE472CA|nr:MULTISPECIES: hypothetical protein [unclassified Nocardia]
MRVVMERSRETKASAKCRKDAKRARRGMYAAATFASMATVMMAGQAAAEAPDGQQAPVPPQAPGMNRGAAVGQTLPGTAGAVAGQLLDPSQQAALNGALGAAAQVVAPTPIGSQVGAAVDAFQAGGAPQAPAPMQRPEPAQPGQPATTPVVGGTPAPAGSPAAIANQVVGMVPTPVAELAATAAQIAVAKLPLEQLAGWANTTFPDGPMRGPVDDLLGFVQQATELAGARRERANPTIDDLIDQARTVFGFPKDGPDPTQALRDLLVGPAVGKNDPMAGIAPGLAALVAPVLGFAAPHLDGLAPVLGFLAPLLAIASNPVGAIGAVLTTLRDQVQGLLGDSRHNAALPLLTLPVVGLFALVPLLFAGGIAVVGALALGAVVLGALLLAPLVIGALVIGGAILAVLAIPVLVVLAVIAIPVLIIALPVAFIAFQVLAPFILAGGLALFAAAVVGGAAVAVVVLALGLAVQIVGFVLLTVFAALATIFVPFLGLIIGPLAFTAALAWLVLGGIGVAVAFFGTLGIAALVSAAVFAVVGVLSLFTPFGLISIPILLALGAAAVILMGAVGLAGGAILAALGLVELVALGIVGGAAVTVLLALVLVVSTVLAAADVVVWAALSAATLIVGALGMAATALAVVGGLIATAAIMIGVPIIGPLLAPLLFIGLVAIPAALGLLFLFGAFTFGAMLTFVCTSLILFGIANLAGVALVASLVFMITMPYAIPIILLADLAFAIIVGAGLAALAAANVVFTWFFGGAAALAVLAFALAASATVFAGGLAIGVLSFALLTLGAFALIITNPPLALLALPVIFGGLLLSVLATLGTVAVVSSLVTGLAAFLGFGLIASWVGFGILLLGTFIAVSSVFPPFLLVSIPVAAVAFVAIMALAIATGTIFGAGIGAILLAGNVIAIALGIAAVIATAAVGVAGFVFAAALTLPFLIFGPLAPVVSTALMPIIALALAAIWSPVLAAGLTVAAAAIAIQLFGLIGLPILAAIVLGGLTLAAKGLFLTMLLVTAPLSFVSLFLLAAIALPILGLAAVGALALLALPVLAVIGIPLLGLAALGALAVLAVGAAVVLGPPVLAVLAAIAIPLLGLAALAAAAVVGGAFVAGIVAAVGAALVVGIPLALLIGVPLLALAAVGALALLALPVLAIGAVIAALGAAALAVAAFVAGAVVALGVALAIGIPVALAAFAAGAVLALGAALAIGIPIAIAVGLPLLALAVAGGAALLALPVLALAAAVSVPVALTAGAVLLGLALALLVLLTPPVRVWLISAIRAAVPAFGSGGAAATGTQFLDNIPDNPSLEQLITSLQQALGPKASAAPANPVAHADIPYTGNGAADGVTHDARQLVSIAV